MKKPRHRLRRLHAVALAAVALGLAAAPGPAGAGLAGGPFIVWVNLGTKDAPAADDAMRSALAGVTPDAPCWTTDALLYMRKRPPGITDDLVRRALLRHDAQAQSSLRALLRKPFDEVPAFDGVIAYTDGGGTAPTLVSMSARGRVKSEAIASPTGEAAWLPTFCNVLPPIDHPA